MCLSLSAAPARASLTMCDRTSYVIYAATASVAGKSVTTSGWTRVTPGGCATAIGGDLAGQGTFVYARSAPAHSGPVQAWGGSNSFCARDGNFSLSNPLGSACKGARALPFAAIDTHHMRTWTMTFTEPGLASLTAAALAGVKRLLRDNGFKIGALDASPDKNAAAALGAFRARVHLPPKATTADLFNALESNAAKKRPPVHAATSK